MAQAGISGVKKSRSKLEMGLTITHYRLYTSLLIIRAYVLLFYRAKVKEQPYIYNGQITLKDERSTFCSKYQFIVGYILFNVSLENF